MRIHSSISLSFKDRVSDKVYHAQIVEEAPGYYVVNFQYGRYGSTLVAGTKTGSKVSLAQAEKIMEKLTNEKLAKGYIFIAGAPAQTMAASSKVSSGILPQLLNPVDEVRLEELLKDDNYLMQRKFDGQRRIIRRNGSVTEGINRKGQIVTLSPAVQRAAELLPPNCILDGEDLGDEFVAFDLLQWCGCPLDNMPFHMRAKELQTLLERFTWEKDFAINYAFVFDGELGKRTAFQNIKKLGHEGVVFKLRSSKIVPGRPNSGGEHLKYKFLGSASLIVHAVKTDKRSVIMKLLDGAEEVLVGAVTIPPNHEVPAVGAVIEVEYLYAYNGGSLFQPIYKGERSDEIDPSACIMSQLKFKPED